MKANHTDITIVLDRSGSMTTIKDETIGGFNRFLQDQKAVPGTADITLHQFDDLFETPIPTSDIQYAKSLDHTTFVPRGWTALYDAIGRSINDTGKRLSEKPEKERAEKVVFVIITDGHENRSREFSAKQIKEMVEHQIKKYQWCFVFLAANQDAVLTGSYLGMPQGTSMSFAPNTRGVTDSYRSVSDKLEKARMTSGPIRTSAMSFSLEEREEQKKAGA